MKQIEFSKDERAEIVARIQRYFVKELDQEIGAIPAEFLLKFFAEEIGGFFYNRGLDDAQTVFAKTVDEVEDALYGLRRREASVR